jgi:chromosome segregation ATPase
MNEKMTDIKKISVGVPTFVIALIATVSIGFNAGDFMSTSASALTLIEKHEEKTSLEIGLIKKDIAALEEENKSAEGDRRVADNELAHIKKSMDRMAAVVDQTNENTMKMLKSMHTHTLNGP